MAFIQPIFNNTHKFALFKSSIYENVNEGFDVKIFSLGKSKILALKLIKMKSLPLS